MVYIHYYPRLNPSLCSSIFQHHHHYIKKKIKITYLYHDIHQVHNIAYCIINYSTYITLCIMLLLQFISPRLHSCSLNAVQA